MQVGSFRQHSRGGGTRSAAGREPATLARLREATGILSGDFRPRNKISEFREGLRPFLVIYQVGAETTGYP